MASAPMDSRPSACVRRSTWLTRRTCSRSRLPSSPCSLVVCVCSASTTTARRTVSTHRRGQLTNDFFVNLLDSTERKVADGGKAELSDGVDRKSGQKKWRCHARRPHLWLAGRAACARRELRPGRQRRQVRKGSAGWEQGHEPRPLRRQEESNIARAKF